MRITVPKIVIGGGDKLGGEGRGGGGGHKSLVLWQQIDI